MSWFKKKPNFGFKIIPRKRETPDGQWLKCDGCGEILYARELERNLRVCNKCDYHFKIGCRDYIRLLCDADSFESRFDNIVSVDPLGFRDSKRYTDRLKDSRKKTQLDESVLTGLGRLHGHSVAVAVMDFAFMGGTLGSATGEKLRRLVTMAVEERRSLIIASTSGGARMQEGILSLMQMAKVADILAEHYEANLPFISIMLNPTTAGVAASYAALGDVIISEPHAMIGFAGPRVIQQTINQELPEGFQTAEFVLEHGMIDMIISRLEMRATVGRLLDMMLVAVREEPLAALPKAEIEAPPADGDQPAGDDGGDAAESPAAAAAPAAERVAERAGDGTGGEVGGDDGDAPAGPTPADSTASVSTETPAPAGDDGTGAPAEPPEPPEPGESSEPSESSATGTPTRRRPRRRRRKSASSKFRSG